MAVKLINLALYDEEIQLLDELVATEKAKSFTPGKVNRSTVIRSLLIAQKIANQKEA